MRQFRGKVAATRRRRPRLAENTSTFRCGATVDFWHIAALAPLQHFGRFRGEADIVRQRRGIDRSRMTQNEHPSDTGKETIFSAVSKRQRPAQAFLGYSQSFVQIGAIINEMHDQSDAWSDFLGGDRKRQPACAGFRPQKISMPFQTKLSVSLRSPAKAACKSFGL
jgi:hypothetical protein